MELLRVGHKYMAGTPGTDAMLSNDFSSPAIPTGGA